MSENDEYQIPSAPDPEQIAHLFPAYEIDGLIASGGMGAVYKARQVSLDRDVAIKLLPREFGDDPEFRSSFESEAKAMAKLNHPNLISVYDFGEADGLLFIIMELVPGKSLFHSAHGTAIEPAEAGRIVSDICDALAHAHEVGILHRDVKPGNILLSPKAEPKIGDFGLARPVGKEHNPEETIFGTPGYTAPEVVSHPDRVDPRADIFSTGVMLHELLTGKLPGDDKRPPSQISRCDPRFDTIVRRATHPNPEMRYPDAGTMAKEIRDLVQALAGPKLRTVVTPGTRGPATRGMVPPRTTRSMRPVASSSSGSGTTWIVIAVIVIVAAIAAIMMRPGSSKPDPKAKTTQQTPSKGSTAGTAKPKKPKRDKPRPKKIIEPEPEPEPVVMVEPEPEPEPEPVAMVEPEPEPEPEPAKPAFDTVSFFERAEDAMLQKARPLIAEQDKAIERNLDSFQRGADRGLRKLDGYQRDMAEEKSDDYFDKLREKGNRIPPEVDMGIEKLPARGKDRDAAGRNIQDAHDRIMEEHVEAFSKQNSLEKQFATEMLALTNTYILGIELQIKRLEEAGDTAAMEILQAEVDRTKGNPERFERMMRGLDPDPPPRRHRRRRKPRKARTRSPALRAKRKDRVHWPLRRSPAADAPRFPVARPAQPPTLPPCPPASQAGKVGTARRAVRHPPSPILDPSA